MCIKNAIRYALFLVLSLPAFALQPEHDDLLTFFRANVHTSGPQVSMLPPQKRTSVVNEEAIQLMFSAFTAFMVVVAIRSQQRQDYTQFRQCSQQD